MKITARVSNGPHRNVVELSTNNRSQSLTIPPKEAGKGARVNGGELLLAALATCYCNDVYREAAKLGIEVEGIEVIVDGEFGEVGAPATSIRYRANVTSPATPDRVRELLVHTDTVAEVHNTLRKGIEVTLVLDA